MNLQEFLEDFQKDTRIEVLKDEEILFSGCARNLTKEKSCSYWVVPGKVVFAEGVMKIEVVQFDELHGRDGKNITIDFDSVFACISEEVGDDSNARQLSKNLLTKARDYVELREQWDSLSPEELKRRNSERSSLHDAFILNLNILAEYLEEKTKRTQIWRRELGDRRKKLGDFAEYIVKKVADIKERIDILEAIIWAQEHHDQITDLIDSSPDWRAAKNKLREKCGVDDSQSKVILDMRTKAFCMDSRKKIWEEFLQSHKKLEIWES